MAGVNNVSFAGTAANHATVKNNKGKKTGTALGVGTGLGFATGYVYANKNGLKKGIDRFMNNPEIKETVEFTIPKKVITEKLPKVKILEKLPEEVTFLKNMPKKTAAVISTAAPIAGVALAATAACAVVGRIGGAIADKIAGHKNQ